MAALTQILVPLALASVALVLFMGLYNLARGGSANMSQKLMRWRVGLQFMAIVIVMASIWLMSPGR